MLAETLEKPQPLLCGFSATTDPTIFRAVCALPLPEKTCKSARYYRREKSVVAAANACEPVPAFRDDRSSFTMPHIAGRFRGAVCR
jgi:hypothetical protein